MVPTTTRARPRWRLALPFGLLLVALVGAPSLVEPMRVAEGSMSPSYDPGDEILVAKFGSSSADLRRGDVIVLQAPAAGGLMIKRVAALGGDRVGIADGVLVVNGRRVREPYVDRARVDGTYSGPVRVPRNTVWVLGDARAGSVDSRTFGAVPDDAIVGRVILRLW